MIDTAIPDTIAEGLINFDKRRKEFEVLARIRLLQGAANAYNFTKDPLFDRWFHSLIIVDDREAYKLSCQIEPPPGGNTLQNRKKKTHQCHQGHRKNDSLASTSSSSSSQFYCDLDSLPSSPHNSLDRRTSPSQMSSSSSSSSLPSLDVSLGSGIGSSNINSNSNKNDSNNNNHNNNNLGQILSTTNNGRSSTPNLISLSSPSNSHNNTPDFYIIKVTIETDNVETDGVIMYKSIMLSNNERTPQVIRNAMLKLCIEGNPDQFTLAQILPDREMVLPNSANVYYAVNTQHNLNFILRPRKDLNDSKTESPKGKSNNKR